MAFFVLSRGNCLVPSSKAAAMEMEALPRGVPLKVEPKQPRNIKFHRLAFAFFTLIADALNAAGGEWDQDKVRRRLMVATGHADAMRLPTILANHWQTDIAVVPRSISFASMDEGQFGRFMDAAMAYVRDDLAPWIEDSPHWPDIETILRESHMLGEVA